MYFLKLRISPWCLHVGISLSQLGMVCAMWMWDVGTGSLWVVPLCTSWLAISLPKILMRFDFLYCYVMFGP